MGSQAEVSRRVVFDTATVLFALLFSEGRLAWLRGHWRKGECIPLISRATAAEVTRVFRYDKFGLSADYAQELLGEYLPYCEVIEAVEPCVAICRDADDQPFPDLAQSGRAESLVSGDRDLLALAGQVSFLIEPPEAYRRRVG